MEKKGSGAELSAVQEFLISVEDTGTGIKSEDIPKLFKMFGKLESHEGVNKNGVGLGLAISQKLVKNINKKKGKIMKFGRGSCFFFPLISHQEINEFSHSAFSNIEELNLEDDFLSKLEKLQRNFGVSKAGTHCDEIIEHNKFNVKVLVVDDDQFNIKIASNFLGKRGNYIYDVVFDGSQAIELIKRKARELFFYDVILMDCDMPIMDGFQATAIIRQMISEKWLPDVKIIACTANAAVKDIEQCFQAGMTDYISKPFTREELQDKIQQVLKRDKHLGEN